MDQALPHILIGVYLFAGIYFYLNIVKHVPSAINPVEGTDANIINISIFKKVRFFIGIFLSHVDEIIIWPISRFYLDLYPEKDKISNITHDDNRNKNKFHFSSWKDDRYFSIKSVYIIYILFFQLILSLVYDGVLLKVVFILSIIAVSSYFISFINGAGVVIEKISGSRIKYIISLVVLSVLGMITMSVSFLGLENSKLINDFTGIYGGIQELVSIKQLRLFIYEDRSIGEKLSDLIYSEKLIRLLGATFIYYSIGQFLYSIKGYKTNPKRVLNNLINAFKVHDYEQIEDYLDLEDSDKVDRFYISSFYNFYKKNYGKSVDEFIVWFRVKGKGFIDLNDENVIFYNLLKEGRNLNFKNDVFRDFLLLWMGKEKCSDLIISQSCRLLFEVNTISPRFLYDIFAESKQEKSFLFTEMLVMYHFHENLEGNTPKGYRTWNFAVTMYSARSLTELNKKYRVVFNLFLEVYSLVFFKEAKEKWIETDVNESLNIIIENPIGHEFAYSVLFLSHTINMLDKHGKEKNANDLRRSILQYIPSDSVRINPELLQKRLELLYMLIRSRSTKI